MTDSAPEMLRDGRYAVLATLGQGAQGATLEAVDKRDGRLVAIKRFSVRGAPTWKDVELAEREARVLSALSHPALPVYIEHFEEAGCLYLVMEKIEGEQLSTLRRKGVPFSRDDVTRFLHDASAALDYLHSRAPPVIHRDIKPGNVIRRPDGSYALVDFGAVRDSLRPEGGSTIVGTFGYMAPEQFQGRAMPASDVYSVGATALTMLTGVEPEDLPHRGLEIDVAAALGSQADPGLVRALSSMVSPDPDRRAARIAPLLEAIDAPVRPSDREPTAWQSPPEGRPRRRRRRRGQRAERRRPRHRHHRRPSDLLAHPLAVVLTLFVLLVARVATVALFRIFLPLLLSLLSILFGSQLRRAAAACTRVGNQGNESLRRAAQIVRERSDKAGALRYAERARARGYQSDAGRGPGQATPRVRVEEPAEDDGELESALDEREEANTHRSHRS
jgi:serine/threonine protein kinase